MIATILFNHATTLSRLQKRAIFLAIDVALVLLVFFGMFVAGPDVGYVPSVTHFAVLAGIAVAASHGLGLPRTKLNAYGRHAAFVTAKFSAWVTFCVAVFCQIVRLPVGLTMAAEFALALFLASVASRYCMLSVLLWVLRKGQKQRRVVIYGAGDTGLQMAVALRSHPHILPVAFLDDDIDLQALTMAGLPVLSPARLESVIRDFAVDRIVLAMPSSSPAKLTQIARKLQAFGVQVQTLPSFAQLVGTEATSAVVRQDSPGQFLGRAAFSSHVPDGEATYAGRVVLVSGAGGSVGSELCRQLIAHHPRAIILYEHSELSLYAIDRELRELAQPHDIRIVPVLGSVADAALARKIMADTGTDVIFHAAAYKHVPLIEANPLAGLANNVIGTQIFAQAAIDSGVGRFVLISTDKAVRPTGMMGSTKRLAELVVHDLAKRSSQTRFSTVRFGNVLGSSGSVVPLFRQQIARGGPVTLTDEQVTRFFMTLSEAAQLVLLSGALTPISYSADVFVLDMGQSIKIRDLAERMIKAQGLTLRNQQNPSGDIEIVVTGLRPGEKLHEEMLLEGPLLPTPHTKVLRAQAVGLSELAVAHLIKAANKAIADCDQAAARMLISTYVHPPSNPQSTTLSQDCDGSPLKRFLPATSLAFDAC